MERLMPTLFGIFTAIMFLNVLWDGFPTLPVLYGVITAASLLFGRACLMSRALPDSQASKQVPAEVRWKWCRVLGILYLLNAALCPLGFLLWYVVRFDSDLILGAQMLGFFIICFASLIPTFHRARA
ncbi:hypothetical protein DWX58_00415 [Pseudoflavonifractor sp. AF19-9AC]|uniref:hypothetical protein n=1 Tax=Pseudoflavonifractor sp. AF19-9AC TaxID=2292244 RepID=UPI000E481D0E|nr:hypothetical protein [Pseudoflavonifractor sp. AF19-9AC]RHR10960.1 hypothetical protein DWX58_00415 [Pseudoflavonifractor sp. AF19-9AC]